ncbi:hypothetical protein [Vannielia litorea]|uniref:hypothetical protein n=1 Tax=Vannielia litorea TaxID=1217970 RepID=UPI001BCD0D24|nr:hypothetical protein [Vannielia litorea]MBS8227106.1 hypothetical protein [Vannielia litorea]
MAKGSTYRGQYWGIDRNGKVATVSEYYEDGGIILRMMNHDAAIIQHAVMPGRQARSEVIIVFGLKEITFVASSMANSEFEASVREQLEAKASSQE